MIKKTLMWIPAALVLAGCATYDQKIDTLEARVKALETKTSTSEQASDPSAPVATIEETTTETKEIVIPDSPTKRDIQAALKNAGFYTGDVDGKIGPQTKKSIEEFQQANGLTPDGKVGPNTWSALKKFYVPEAAGNETEGTKE